ncbi:hypothetical protein DPEC_G00102930 [Dallia pectoralis]|uniref:Uncharacterized protein n=1 Tax=Dallia pectoralis TaxID=75939 RepID=A0ACC2GY59_DALPE|nr:hypothetical protein DPEC_G00102930 [Dallia pectoralis]
MEAGAGDQIPDEPPVRSHNTDRHGHLLCLCMSEQTTATSADLCRKGLRVVPTCSGDRPSGGALQVRQPVYNMGVRSMDKCSLSENEKKLFMKLLGKGIKLPAHCLINK